MKKLVIDWNSYNSIQDMPKDVRDKYFNESKSNVLDALWDAATKTTISSENQNISHNNSYSQKTISQVLDTFENNTNENNTQINSIDNQKQIEILKEDFKNVTMDNNSQNKTESQKSVNITSSNINSFLDILIIYCKSFYSDSKYIFWLIISILVLLFLFIFIIN